jgi:putative transposase
MSSYLENHQNFTFRNALAPFAQDQDLPLAEVLSEADVVRIFAEEKVSFGTLAHSFWTPALTLWAFLWQVISPDKSCRQVVANVLLSFALSHEPEDIDTGLYCRARAKLPSAVLRRLALHVGHGLERVAPEDWLWKGKHVQLVDGSTSRLPDTEENQKAFPQPKTQKPGLGTPLIRWVVLIGLATAAVQGFAYGPYAGKETGETALFRELLEHLKRGDIVLADRFYCSYFVAAMLRTNDIDLVARLHQGRKYDFRRGQRLGEGDHIVVWYKPKRPEWMSEELYALVPATIRMREIIRGIDQPGYRVEELVIATTLLDAQEYQADEIVELYSKRWNVEVDIRSLKVTLGMSDLRCKTPFMVEREIWAHLLAYNFIRKVGAQVAQQMKVSPRSVSFKATKQAILGGWQGATKLQGADYVRVAKVMLKILRKQKVGNRPGRCEPRAVKVRPKAQKLLTEPRRDARAKLLQGKSPKEE